MRVPKPLIEKIDGKYYDNGELIEFIPPDKTGWTKEQYLQHKDDMIKFNQQLDSFIEFLKTAGKKHNG